jgi:hypothetical protein
MSTDLAQNPKWDEDRIKVGLDDLRAAYSAAGSNNLEASRSADGHYLPGKWSWGSAKSSFDW